MNSTSLAPGTRRKVKRVWRKWHKIVVVKLKIPSKRLGREMRRVAIYTNR